MTGLITTIHSTIGPATFTLNGKMRITERNPTSGNKRAQTNVCERENVLNVSPGQILHEPVAVKIGYARVSTEEQKPNGQIEALEKAGCERVHKEYASGGRWDRPELQHILQHIEKGNVLVVWKLDRLTRSLSDLLRILKTLEEAGAGFRSLTEAIDTTSPVGRMLMQVLGSFAEFERAILKERTKLGLAAGAELHSSHTWDTS